MRLTKGEAQKPRPRVYLQQSCFESGISW